MGDTPGVTKHDRRQGASRHHSSPMSSLDLRRLRQNEHVRALTREVHVQLDQLIQPLFVAEVLKEREPVPGLTGVHQETCDSLLRQVEQDLSAGVRKFLLFGVPTARSERQIDWSFTAGQIRALKQRFGHDIWLAADVCLCSSTPHGHCGVLNAEGNHLDNRASVAELEQAALSLCPGRCRLRRAQRHDGWAYRRHPLAPGRGRTGAHHPDELRGQISFQPLWAISRGSGLRPQGRCQPLGSSQLPAGSGASPGRLAVRTSAMPIRVRTS